MSRTAGCRWERGKENAHFNNRAVCALPFDLVLWYFYILTDEFLLDKMENTLWTISTASRGNTWNTMASVTCGVASDEELAWFSCPQIAPDHEKGL